MKATIVALISSALCLTAVAQMTEKQWRTKAVEKYPALGIQGSELNKQFIDAYTTRRKTDLNFLSNPRWPLILADELAAASLAAGPKTIAPRPPEPPSAIGATPKPIVSNTRSVPVPPSTAVHATQRPIQSTKATDSQFPEDVIPIAVVGVVGLIICGWAVNAAQRRKHRARLYVEAREYVGSVQQGQALPIVHPTSF